VQGATSPIPAASNTFRLNGGSYQLVTVATLGRERRSRAVTPPAGPLTRFTNISNRGLIPAGADHSLTTGFPAG
jgi:hypothetical protein